MAAKLEEIVGVYLKERVRFGDVAIGEIELPEAPAGQVANIFTGGNTARIKGEWLPNIADEEGNKPPESETLLTHRTYRFYGKWITHPKYGKQFAFQSFLEAQPFGRLGVISYLTRCPGIGQKTAMVLWDKFRSDAVRIVREQPAVAVAAVVSAGINSFTEARAAEAAEHLVKHASLEACTIDLQDLFAGRGFRHKLPTWLVNGLGLSRRGYGNRAAEEVKNDPYILLNYPGCGFPRTDAIYLDLGHDPRSIRRQSLAAWHHLHIDNNGHSYFPVEHAVNGIRAKIGGADVDPPGALKAAKEAGLLAFRRDEQGRLWAAEAKAAEQERHIADSVAELLAEGGSDWPALDETDGLSDHQAAEWAKATTSHIGLFTGYGGTGKTFVIARAVKRILDQFGAGSIALCAPTWAAANRMTESLAEYDIEFEATSIHSLLGFKPNTSGEWDFSHDGGSKLPFRFIICDEGSMPGTPIFSALISAVGRDGNFLLVGDTGQLPPVDHGAPMRDLIAAGLPRGELTEVRRNAGTLVNSLKDVRFGKNFRTDPRIDLSAESPANFYWIEESDPERQIEKCVKVFRAAEMDGKNLAWDVKAVCAVNKNSKLGRENLNNVLQRELNRTGTKVGDNPFMVGDPVVKHGKRESFAVDKKRQGDIPCKTDDEGKVTVTNREQGEVVEVQENLAIVKLMRGKSPVFIKVPMGKRRNAAASEDGDSADDRNDKLPYTGCNWTMAYAITVHISQGGQWPVVVTMVDDYPGARRVCDRSWLYTALSRPTKLQVAIGRKAVAVGMLRQVKIDKRKTFLKEEILERLAKAVAQPAEPAAEPVAESPANSPPKKYGTLVPYPPILNGKEAAHVNG